MRIEEIVGRRVRGRREELGLSQAQLGKLIGGHLGRDWPRQAVSAAEKGQRSFGIAEMTALADVLGASIGDLIEPLTPCGQCNDSVPEGFTCNTCGRAGS